MLSCGSPISFCLPFFLANAEMALGRATTHCAMKCRFSQWQLRRSGTSLTRPDAVSRKINQHGSVYTRNDSAV
ncbi:hypothetical protein B0T24DRAFT_622960 [Lasiosphaeria ovina]|uniref:Uncharacterized protein n=1 Tax=Lasiosphaeria ovina TaxID=92902 RepID=A0AAE0KB05_9PEZI|nr:hypothetical protein B0T24DRAFT_622960 [Lasiosphaeria ovina]